MLIKEKKISLALFFFSIFAIFSVRVIYNFYLNLPLHFDEAQYWDWSQNLDWGYFSKPPFLAFLIRLITETCGSGENCIKSLSAFIHSLTSIIIFLSVYSMTKNYKKSFFGSLLFLLMPGITFSSFMISTDVPLIFFSSLIALILIKSYYSKVFHNTYVFLLALALALGFLSKYAIFYIILSCLLSTIIFKDCRSFFLRKQFIITLFITVILILPNIFWNYKNQFVTFSHTADNANLNYIQLNFLQGIIFLFSQIVMFGIIPIILLFYKYISLKNTYTLQKILFLCFIFPIILVFLLAIFSRANANWAVVGYPFGCILLASLINIKNNFYKNICLINQYIFFAAIFLLASILPLFDLDPFSKVRHIKILSEVLKKELINGENIAFMADDREDYAHLLYYLKDIDVKKAKWNGDNRIDDHYELTTHQNHLIGKKVLFVTRTKPTDAMIEKSSSYEKIDSLIFKTNKRSKIFNIYLFKDWK